MDIGDIIELLSSTFGGSDEAGGGRDARQLARVRGKLSVVLSELGFGPESSDGERSLNALEARLDDLLRALGVAYDEVGAMPDAAIEALRQGKTVEAIYYYRRATGASLKEAYAAVRSVEPALIAETSRPESLPPSP